MMQTLHIEKVLKNNPDIRLFRFIKFSFENKVQDRLSNISSDEMSVIERCIKHKRENDISFWESYIRLGEDLNSRLFEHATFHNENNEYIYISKNNVIDFLKYNKEKNLALNSQVIMKNGQILHIPMLDFEVSSKANNIESVKNILKHFKLSGTILDSGKSYHFIGNNLIEKKSLIVLLSKFSLLYPIADRAWASHQIIENSASLRVSKKYGEYPNFIEDVN